MTRTDRRKEATQRSSNEGSAARTRPYSFEEIMSRRKKKLIADAKGKDSEIKESSEKGHANGAMAYESDGGPPKRKISLKDDSRKPEEATSRKDQDHFNGKDKGTVDLEVQMKVKSSYSRSVRDKESKNEEKYHYRSRNDNRSGDRSEKKRSEDLIVKDKHEERDKKSRKEGKRKHEGRIDEKIKSEIELSVSKKRDSGKLRDTEYSERRSRKKEQSPTYHEQPRSKRRRSRSREFNQERERSASYSPREHRRPYNGRDYDESTFQASKDRSRRKHSDTDKYGTSKNGGYASGNYRKHGSGLGGYSPRKRRTEVAVKIPSPTIRSPERKSSTWDQPPPGTSNNGPGSALSNSQSTSKMLESVSSTPVAPPVTKVQSAPSQDSLEPSINASIDSVQLTQATRPMRRLYVENLPASASDKSVIHFINELLLASHVNHIQGAKPCISCIINKEKCQAVLEFLTPEDATAALSLDGRSLSGSVLKIRRPKDFVEAGGFQTVAIFMQTGALAKNVPVVKDISDLVKDSPHKIFIGGISKALSSDMFMEIVCSFGTLRAYHYEFMEEPNGPCAFLEYEDHSVTQKACAGLNGMKLGGKVLTAVQAFPDSHGEDDAESPATYGLPQHAKSLLLNSTQVLKLNNLFNFDEFLLLSEPELEETMEDIRLECARFGTIKSVNIVRCRSSDGGASGTPEMQDANGDLNKIESGAKGPSSGSKINEDGNVPPPNEDKNLQDISTEEKQCDDENPSKDLNREDFQGALPVDGASDPSVDPPSNSGGVEDVKMEESHDTENGLASEMQSLEVSNANVDHMLVETTDLEEGDAIHVVGDLQACDRELDVDVFEPGCVLVEFLRKESASLAAHCLHGRLYGERVVSVVYVPYDLYLSRFPR